MITADEWMGMYHIAADRADKAEAENERYKLMIKSITGGLDEAIEAVHFLETENAKLRKVVEGVETLFKAPTDREYQQAMLGLHNIYYAELDEEGER